MDTQEWRAWLDQSRAKQAQLNQQNYAMPAQNWQDPQTMGPMQGGLSVGGARPDVQTGSSQDWARGLMGDPGSMAQAPGYRPGMGSMTPAQQLAADNQWDENFRAQDALLNQIPQHVSWGDPRVQNVMNNQITDAQAYNAYPSFGAPTPQQGPMRQTPAQLADWERYAQIMAKQRPNQGLR